MHDIQLQPMGDAAVRVAFGRVISDEVHRKVRTFCAAMEKSALPGLLEWVPAYAAVTVYYDPWYVRYEEVLQHIHQIWEKKDDIALSPGKTWVLPVCYEGEFGSDLNDTAAYTGLDVKELVARHTAPSYTVYMIGFTPGFPYLGGMDSSIEAPRLENPRSAVPAGAVGIAGSQTGVYSLKSPGGWRIIGRTPVKLYDRLSDTPVFLQAGDRIRFKAVTSEEYSRIAREVEAGSYQVRQARSEQQ